MIEYEMTVQMAFTAEHLRRIHSHGRGERHKVFGWGRVCDPIWMEDGCPVVNDLIEISRHRHGRRMSMSPHEAIEMRLRSEQ